MTAVAGALPKAVPAAGEFAIIQQQRGQTLHRKQRIGKMQQLQTKATEVPFALPNIKGTRIYASFDRLDLNHGAALVYGWAFDAANPDNTPEIFVSSEKGIIGHGKAELERPDVSAAGGPKSAVGFQIRLKPRGDEKTLKIFVQSNEQSHLLNEITIKESLPIVGLTREDVISVFFLLFHRYPESEDAINHQLSVHKNKESLFSALFCSPEFHEKNMDVLSIMQDKITGI